MSEKLIASRLHSDPRIQQSKKLVMDVIQSPEYALHEVKPPTEEYVQSYEQTLQLFNRIRGGNLYFPFLGSGWGTKCLVELLDGSVKYDMITGIGPHFWGHSYPPLIEVAMEAVLSDTIMQGHLQQNKDALLISELLVKASGLAHCFLSSSGAMANENALKLSFQKRNPARRILAFERCFMGRTLVLSQITDKPNFREGLPDFLSVDYLPFFSWDNPEESTERTLHALQRYVERYPLQHAVMCFELVQGEGGFHTAPREFFVRIMQFLKEQQIPIFIDEIQTFGRTSELFAFQHFKLEEYVDIVSIGKLSQVCATLFRSEFKPKPGLMSQTFTSSTVALQTSYWIIQHLLADGFYGDNGKNSNINHYFEEHFSRIKAKWPEKIGGPYGIGAMIVFTPFDGESKRVAKFVQDLFHAGVIAFTAGSHPTRVRFLVPGGVISKNDIDAVIKIVESVLEKG